MEPWPKVEVLPYHYFVSFNNFHVSKVSILSLCMKTKYGNFVVIVDFSFFDLSLETFVCPCSKF